MDENDDKIASSNTFIQEISSSLERNVSNSDLDDIVVDDDDEPVDDDYFVSIDDVQNILQTFGKNDCSTSSLDYFDSRRHEIMYEIMNIEKQFDELKNILYEETILLIDRKLLSIQNEEAPEYQNELKKFYEEMKLDLEIAKQRRQIELEALENSIESELLSLEQTLENDKHLLYHNLDEDLRQRIDELEKLKMKTQLCSSILNEIISSEHQQQCLPTVLANKKRLDTSESTKRNVKKRRCNSAKKTVEKDNLAIFYQLSDVNILEDWALIKASSQQSSRNLQENDMYDSDS